MQIAPSDAFLKEKLLNLVAMPLWALSGRHSHGMGGGYLMPHCWPSSRPKVSVGSLQGHIGHLVVGTGQSLLSWLLRNR